MCLHRSHSDPGRPKSGTGSAPPISQSMDYKWSNKDKSSKVRLANSQEEEKSQSSGGSGPKSGTGSAPPISQNEISREVSNGWSRNKKWCTHFMLDNLRMSSFLGVSQSAALFADSAMTTRETATQTNMNRKYLIAEKFFRKYLSFDGLSKALHQKDRSLFISVESCKPK